MMNDLVYHIFGDCEVMTCSYLFDDLCSCDIPLFLTVIIDYCSAKVVRAPYIVIDMIASELHYDQ